ncbi:MAG: hypothetical protein KGQ93_14275 [Cyanobacteria bacterium REEB459]|nr:hypothetical protein [Cyanobacteria bacterium REEB459]
MNDFQATASTGPEAEELKSLAGLINQIALERQGDSVALLELLRLLEQHHRQVCETFFQEALPNNRHGLYRLLRDIERQGGWPYIQRMKLRSLLANYSEGDDGQAPVKPESTPD